MAEKSFTHLTEREVFFLKICHLVAGWKRLNGFEWKTVAEDIGIGRQYLSQILNGNMPMTDRVKKGLIRNLGLEKVFDSKDPLKREDINV